MFHNLNRSGFTVCFVVVFFIYLLVKLVEAELTDDLIPALYLKYKDAIDKGESNISIRRLLNNNKQYEIHVKRLKEVNGFKRHNLMVKETMRSNDNPLIYINNPVESKTPYAYLSLEEFKNALTNRIQAQKDELAEKRLRVIIRKNVTDRYVPTKPEIKKIFNKNITPRLLKTDMNKAENNTNDTKSTLKEKTFKESIQNVFVHKELKPIVTTKHEFNEQNIGNNKIHNGIVNRTLNHTLKDISETLEDRSVTLQGTSMLIKMESSSLRTTTVPEMYTEANNVVNITENQSLDVTLKDASEFLKIELDSKISSFSIPVSITEATEKASGINDKEINNNETNAFPTNTNYSEAYNTLTILVNFTTNAMFYETPFTTTEIVTLQTKEVKKETPKRSTASKKNKQKKGLLTKSTKRKRSTLGRPLVFME